MTDAKTPHTCSAPGDQTCKACFPVRTRALYARDFAPCEDSWCNNCKLPTMMVAPVYDMSFEGGVGLWGTITGCVQERNFVWVDLKGNEVKVAQVSYETEKEADS